MMKHKITNRFFALAMSLCMLLGMLPMSAFAAETVAVSGETSVTMQKGVAFFGTGTNNGYYVLTPPDGVTFTNIEWSVSGDLPAGITLGVNSADGAGSSRAFLSGTPTAMTSGAVSVTVSATATDSDNNTYTGSISVSITVEDSPAEMKLDELIQGAACEVDMTTANTAEDVVSWIQNTWLPSLDGYSELVGQLANGWSITVEAVSTSEESIGGFTAAVAGTEADPDGTDGSLTVRFRLDENSNYLESTKTCTIKATAYTTHTHSYTAVVTAPTCKEQGYTTYTCSCNDSYVSDYVDALDHDWGDYVSIGNGRHTRVCRNDSSHEQTTTCGGTATCHELAFCPDCKTTYGEYDQDNHSGGTEVRNAKKATETENGYTGDTYCLGCNVLISEGSIIYATGSGDDDDTHTHNYSYYKFDGTNHWKMCHCGQGQAGSVKPHSLITTGASTGHFEECTVCDYFSDVEAHVYSDDSDAYCNECGYRRHVHDYSTAATCSSPAKCGCGATTGSKDPSNHVGGTEIRNAVEATWETEGYTGDTYCKGCGAKLESGKGIPMKGYVIVKIDDDVVVEDVTFTPGEGLVLPEDAVLVVDPHTPSEENIYFLLPPNTDMEYVSVASDDIALVTPFMLNGVTFYQYDVVVFGGEEFVVVGNTDDGLHLVSFSDGNSYFFDGEYLRLVDVAPRIDIEKRDNQKLNINGVTYDVVAALDGQASLDRLILYHNGKPAGQYHLTTGKATFNEGFDPETLKAQQNVNDIGTVTTGENPIDGLESGKTYNVSVIGSQDISVPGYDEAVLNSIKAETEEEKAAKKEVERLKADMEAKRAALDQLDTNDPNHMEAWAAWDEAETAYKEALAELAALANLQSATVTQKFQIPDALVGRNNVKFVAVHNTNPHATALAAAKYKMEETMIDYWEYHGDSDEERQRLYEAANRAAMEWSIVQEHYNAWEKEHATDAETGNELGAVTIAEDGKTLTATYTVNSFSPFTVYAFVEADESEIKTLSATIVDDATEQPANLTWLWITIAVVVAAGGGFAVYWFVIRKRRNTVNSK